MSPPKHKHRRGGGPEKAHYDFPLPERHVITATLRESPGPRELKQIANSLKLTKPEMVDALSRRLAAMARDGQLVRNRRGAYGLPAKMDLITGRVVGHPDGFGFLISDGSEKDVFLPAKEMRSLLHGDRAIVRLTGSDRRGRQQGAVVEILERANHEVVGRYHLESGVGFVVPDNKRLAQDILIPSGESSDAQDGQIVVAAIVEQPGRRHQPIGRISEVLGDHLAPGMEIDIAMRAHGLAQDWPDEVRAELGAVPNSVTAPERHGRQDLRELPLVTIDGEDARDFDDAVYCEPQGKGWRLLVAIADVSHYVRPDTALDDEGQARGTSVYFPDRVIPMLPEALSNGICSLNPEVERLCMVCELHITKKGKIETYSFYDAVMRSAARLTYTDVAGLVVDRDPQLRRERRGLVKHLDNLYSLYQLLKERRESRGAIDFDTVETQILFDANGKIDRIEPRSRNDAHRLIEECMVSANIAAARFLEDHKLPGLYRVHARPDTESVDDLRSFLGEFGLHLGGGGEPSAADFGALMHEIAGREDRHLIQTVLLRSLKLAVYTTNNGGHFGLALDAYTHFTSPIRRYPDLLVHRCIRHQIEGRSIAKLPYNKDKMQGLAEHCSMTERRADDATRDAVSWLKCEYMQDKVGQIFTGTISSVTGFGLFVELNDVYVEGLIHVTALPGDYYHHDAVGHRMTGERTGNSYRLGDKVEVKVVRVTLEEKKIDFELVGQRKVKRGKIGGKTAKGGAGSNPSQAAKSRKPAKSGKSPNPSKTASSSKAKPAKSKSKAASNARPKAQPKGQSKGRRRGKGNNASG